MKFSMLKSITLVSSKPMLNTHRMILTKLFDIIVNYFKYKRTNPSNLFTFEGYKKYTLISFYFSFFLNSLDLSSSYDSDSARSFYIIDSSDREDSEQVKFYIDNGSLLPLYDFDMSILLERFYIEDLIMIYQGILLEYKIILVFNNYEEINVIINSLLSLIYPFKWKYPINSYMLQETSVLLDAPFAIVIGVSKEHMGYINFRLKKKQFTKETVIYDLTEKQFIFVGQSFQALPVKMMNDLRSALYFLKSEKLNMDVKSNISLNPNCDMIKTYNNNEGICNVIDPSIYFNMKMISIFYSTTIRMIKNFDMFYKVSMTSKDKNEIKNQEINELYDFDGFTENFMDKTVNEDYYTFFSNFIKTLMFSNFLRSYLLKKETKSKYTEIAHLIKILKTNDEKIGKKLIKKLFMKAIKRKTIQYYKVSYHFI